MPSIERTFCDKVAVWVNQLESRLDNEFLAKYPDFGARLLEQIREIETVSGDLAKYELTMEVELNQRFPELEDRILEAIRNLPVAAESPGRRRSEARPRRSKRVSETALSDLKTVESFETMSSQVLVDGRESVAEGIDASESLERFNEVRKVLIVLLEDYKHNVIRRSAADAFVITRQCIDQMRIVEEAMTAVLCEKQKIKRKATLAGSPAVARKQLSVLQPIHRQRA